MTESEQPRTPRPLPPYPSSVAPAPASGTSPYGPPPQGPPVAPYPPGRAAPARPWGPPEPPKHPSAGTALTLGILSVAGVFCFIGPVLGPVAWWLGHQVVTEIDRSPGRYSGRSAAEAGRTLGIIGTVLLALGGLFVVLVAGVAATGY